MKTINYAGMLLLSLAMACNSATENNTKEKVVENAVVSEEAKEIPNEQLIVPGKQVGVLYLGQDMKEVNEHMGKVDDGDAAMGSALSIWKKDSITIFSSYRDSNMVVKAAKQISVGSPVFNTADHIHTGAKLSQLIKIWPDLKKASIYVNEKTNDSLYVYDDIAAGIAFDIQSDTCSRITVHTKNKESNGSYLSMYPGWKKIQ